MSDELLLKACDAYSAKIVSGPQSAMRAAIALVRDATLEEAAKRCNDFLGGAWHGYEIGSAIRALKDQTTT